MIIFRCEAARSPHTLSLSHPLAVSIPLIPSSLCSPAFLSHYLAFPIFLTLSPSRITKGFEGSFLISACASHPSHPSGSSPSVIAPQAHQHPRGSGGFTTTEPAEAGLPSSGEELPKASRNINVKLQLDSGGSHHFGYLYFL